MRRSTIDNQIKSSYSRVPTSFDLECLAYVTSDEVFETFSIQNEDGTFGTLAKLKIDMPVPAELIDQLKHHCGEWRRENFAEYEYLIYLASFYIPLRSANQSRLYETFTELQRGSFCFPIQEGHQTKKVQRQPVRIFSRSDFPNIVFVDIEVSHYSSSSFCFKVDIANNKLTFEVGREFTALEQQETLYLALLELCVHELNVIENVGKSVYARDIESDVPPEYRQGTIARKRMPISFSQDSVTDDEAMSFIESYKTKDIEYTQFESTVTNYLDVAATILRVFYPDKADLDDASIYNSCSDGRCGDLLNIERQSVDEFQRIAHDMSGLHPWEIIRGPISLEQGLHLRPIIRDDSHFELELFGGEHTNFYPRIIRALNALHQKKGVYLRCLRNNLIAFARKKDLVLVSGKGFITNLEDSTDETPVLNCISFEDLQELDASLVEHIKFEPLEIELTKADIDD